MCRSDPWHNSSATALSLYSDGEKKKKNTVSRGEKNKVNRQNMNIVTMSEEERKIRL